ncbi:MAG: pteridine reductase [Gammaproteobacteria bacterium]|nr:pteridine reductase [Gammaproteobacteria bacterium]
MTAKDDETPVALVTGAARRIGATIARTLHAGGFRVLVHYGRSRGEAESLCEALNHDRPGSTLALAADLRDAAAVEQLAAQALGAWNRLDVLVNNASAFYPASLAETTPAVLDEMVAVNLKAPLLLVRAPETELRARRGAVVNIADIYADRPLRGHAAYCASKAALVNLTRSLAMELASEVRVNAVAPGAILWPEGAGDDDHHRKSLVARTPLARLGEPGDIAGAVRFLATEGAFITGQVLNVDGGRSVVP